jgi:GntR family negative regulator for fad regulon and positive regulator of fabA
MEWTAPPRPVDYAEQALVTAILDGTYQPHSALPGERDLAAQLGITRPTLREVLRRLERDGWISVRHGKSTVVNDIWREGGLNVLSALVRYSREHLPPDFILSLLEVRLQLAPAFTCAAISRDAAGVAALLADYAALPDDPDAFAAFDWRVQHTLTVLSGNPIYTLMLNGFAGFYEEAARLYFAQPEARAASIQFYAALLEAAQRRDALSAERITRVTMQLSIRFWMSVQGEDLR